MRVIYLSQFMFEYGGVNDFIDTIAEKVSEFVMTVMMVFVLTILQRWQSFEWNINNFVLDID